MKRPIIIERINMNYLKIQRGRGYYLKNNPTVGSTTDIDISQIAKDDLLELVNAAIEDDDFSMEDPNSSPIQNEAHRIIYEAIYKKLDEIHQKRQQLLDQENNLFLDAFKKYE